MKWEIRGENHNLREAVLNLSGMTMEELTYPADTVPSEIENMALAAERVKRAICDNEPIHVFGDYDADGVGAAAILFLTFQCLGVKPVIRIPKRMSEGYGISEKAIDEIESGLLITVDNGIAAHPALEKAKEKGLTVIVIDHHLPGDTLPPADIIIDPHVHKENNGYEDFCGAGLAYKLAELLLPAEDPLLKKLVAIAAVSTVADVVPLTGANRCIVKNGIAALNRKEVTKGMKDLLDACEFTVIREQEIGFKLAPTINAMGRLYDDGARIACGCIAQDAKNIPQTARKLIEANEQRKRLVNEEYQSIACGMKENPPTSPIVVYVPTMHEGIVGIVAGKLAEEFKMPAFVFTGEGDEIKGSGRSYGDIHLKELVDEVKDLTIRYGGHAGAVGVGLKKDNFDAFSAALKQILKDSPADSADTIYYDIEIRSEDVRAAINELTLYAPFGEHNPRPTFKVSNIKLAQSYGQYVKYIGSGGEHIRLVTYGYSLIGFGLAEKYRAMGEPKEVDVIGYLSMNESKYGSCPQIEIVDIRPCS